MAERNGSAVIAPRATHRGRISRDEALELTRLIKVSGQQLWSLVAEAHDRNAWRALGYETWRAYVTIELGMSESRSYQLIDTGKVIRQLTSGNSSVLEDMAVPTQRQVARAKEHLPMVTRTFKALVKDGARPDEALSTALRELPPKPRTAPKASPRHYPEGSVECPTCHGLGYVSEA